MAEYGPAEQEAIEALFRGFRNADVRFVVPRGYRDLPERTPGGDVDVIVAADDYTDALSVCRERGFTPRTGIGARVGKLVRQARADPAEAATVLVSNPRKVYRLGKTAVVGEQRDGDRLAARYSEHKVYDGDVMVHLMNHVAYTSPWTGENVRADPAVERKLHERSDLVDGIRVPSPPDELAHLVCRGVFDYEGEFTDYYRERCEELKADVLDDASAAEQFEELLSLLFFEASEVVLEDVMEGDYDRIKSDLVRYSDY